MIRVHVWNEGRHEQTDPRVQAAYPEGIHGAIAAALASDDGLQVTTATQDDPGYGLSPAILDTTDVLVFWSHIAQHEFPDALVADVAQRVLNGLGLVVLHSGCISKLFTRLMGTTGMINWREADERTRLWVVAPGHPIAVGLPAYFELPHEEMYGEHFDIPPPDELVFISWFQGGEVVRSGCCFYRGAGRIFYFQPGHETYPNYRDANVGQVLRNAVKWAAPTGRPAPERGNVPPLEPLPSHH